MAASTAAARRYAEALFAAARTENQIEAVEGDLLMLNGLIQQSPQVLDVLRNPLLPAERKRLVIDRLFTDTLRPISLRFLHLLVDKQRSEVLTDIYTLYMELADEHRGILPAYVTSAVPLTPAEEQAITSRFSGMLGKQIVLHTEVRPELIGGVRVRVGDSVFDGSVVGYLRQLREKFKDSLL